METDKPHFRLPPLVEVLCGVQFSGAEEWATPHFGLYWERFREQYPDFQEHPPLSLIKIRGEEEGGPEFLPLPAFRRVFFLTRPANFLLQIQSKRLLHNWRKSTDEDQYPRFPEAFARFKRLWEEFVKFAQSAGLTPPEPTVYELQYVNHIHAPWAKFPRDIWRFLSFYEANPSARLTGENSATSLHFEWELEHQPRVGTLLLDVKHGVRPSTEEQVLLVELSVRGRVRENSLDDWFSRAHDAIVSTFAAITTTEAHSVWEKS